VAGCVGLLGAERRYGFLVIDESFQARTTPSAGPGSGPPDYISADGLNRTRKVTA
jgi:hypothetical protein